MYTEIETERQRVYVAMHDTPLTMHHTSATGNELDTRINASTSLMSPADSVVLADSSWDGAAQCSPLYEHIKEIHYWKRDFVTGTGQARGYKQKNKQTWKGRETQTSLPLKRHQGNEASWGQQSLTSPTLTASETVQQLINKVGSSFTAFDVIRLAMAFFTVCSGWRGNWVGEAELMWLLPVFCFILFLPDKALLFIKVQGCSPRELVGISWKK